MYQSVEDELRKLNRESFQAEDDAKREPLEHILADDKFGICFFLPVFVVWKG